MFETNQRLMLLVKYAYGVEGFPIHATSTATTVADGFQYRNKIGLDVAIEALRDCLQQRMAMINEVCKHRSENVAPAG